MYALFGVCGCHCGVRLVYALFLFPCLLPRCPASICTFWRNKKKNAEKKAEKRGGKDMHFMAVKLAGLVYALYAAKSEARRLV